jgi:prolyl-tRNA editing enzyme YbaK/EbsC (Cys-tRNA(Pro) deacylase)
MAGRAWATLPAVSGWPEPVERVLEYLRDAGGEARVEEFPGGTPTAQDAAAAAGCNLGQIVKSLVFDCDGQTVLAMVPGDRKADARKVAAAANATKARVATPERVEELTGFAPGAVAPFPLPQVERVFLDRRLLLHDLVWVGAGSSRHMAGLAPTELVRLSRATPVDLSADDKIDI